MPAIAALLLSLLVAAPPVAAPPPTDRPAIVVNAPDTPVKLDRATLLFPPEGPPVLLYAATNQSGNQFEVFTVIAFIFDAQGTLKARQTAPSRRTLDPHQTKYSTLVIDGEPVGANEILVVGVNQAQRADNEEWWRGDIEAAAKAAAAAAVKPKK